jgi:hypothetical protein
MKTYEFIEVRKNLKNPIVEEIERYRVIADYFGKKSRLAGTNQGYIDDIVLRLFEIKEMQLPREANRLCSILLEILSIKSGLA